MIIPLDFNAQVVRHREGYWLFYPMGSVLGARRLPDDAAAEALQARLSNCMTPLWIGLAVAAISALLGYLALAAVSSTFGLLWAVAAPLHLARGLPLHTHDASERIANGLEWAGVGIALALLSAGVLLAYLR